MIFRVIVIIFLAVSVQNACSQTYIGIKSGLSNSWHDGPLTTNSIKRGVAYGITGNKTISDKFSLKSDILIVEKGYKQRFNNNDLFDQLTSTYLDIPISLAYSIVRQESHIAFQLNAGGYYGRWLSGKYKSRIIEGSQVLAEKYAFTKDYNEAGYKDNRNEWGVVGGISLILPSKSNLLIFDLRYVHGLNSIQQFEGNLIHQDIYNRSVVFFIAYGFGL